MVADEFTRALKRAMEKQLPVMDLLNAVGTLMAAGETSLTLALYRDWIAYNQDHKLLHAIYFNYGVILTGANQLPEAKQAMMDAIRVNPDFFPAYINLGHVCERMGAAGEGVNHWYALVNRLGPVTGENVDFKTAALKQVARILERYQVDPKAEEALNLSLALNPNQSDALQHFVSLRQRQVRWPVIKPWANVTRTQLLNGISALSLGAHTDDPLLQLGNSYRYAKDQVGQPKISFKDRHATLKAETGPLRIGYLSSDLREHAIGFLTAEMYGLHDRKKVEVFAYYCGPDLTDSTMDRIRGGVDHWINLSSMNDEVAARRIADDKIQILVDINGYTNSARSKVLAMRPAPIIVNWLGFPGTMGTPYHNYIVADGYIIPPGSERYYTEKVLRLPCYQPNDRKRLITKEAAVRADAKLPEDAVVFCCFNGIHKITPFTWRRWMQILKAVPNSVLWLLDGMAPTNKRLKELAVEHGVDAERIIFARKKHNPDHLARYPLADLFLDTTPYGAHTTSSDALWMGVPVLTFPGRSFASRVCGSLVTSAGLPELVCATPDEFVARAIELGNEKAKLTAVRAKLAKLRDTCVLFDTPLLVSKFEALYQEMWRDFMNDRVPRPNLANLEIYNDIGVELDQDDVEMLVVADYEERYRQKLAKKSEYLHICQDVRLWTGHQEPQS
jgi:predicted O-linked N-acetylglucosamine transferase (SPINDLY family)